MGFSHRTIHPEVGQTAVVDSRSVRALAAQSSIARVALVVAGVGVLVASARISVPFYPVPLTLQTLAVLLVGGFLGPRLGVAAVAGYLALGLSGAPVFSAGLGGPAVLVGPTAGYLVGFMPAALLMGLAGHRGWDESAARLSKLRIAALLALGALAAEACIYALGLPWLTLTVVKDFDKAVSVGLVPFLLGDLAKAAVAVMAIHGGKNLLGRRGPLPF